MEEENILPSVKQGGNGVMFWGCVSWMGVGPLVPVYENLRGDDYARILLNIPRVKRALNIQSAYLIEDWSRVYTTSRVLDVKEDLSLKDLELPTYSPDLNILENMWSVLKTNVAACYPETLEELGEVVRQEWTNIPREDIRTYFYSIPNRLEDVIRAHGRYTKYLLYSLIQ